MLTEQESPEHERRRPLLTNVVWIVILLFLPVFYVLSYAPVHRLIIGPDVYFEAPINVSFAGGLLTPPQPNWLFYRPVELLMDHTPLAEPLFHWADVWECGATVRSLSTYRVNMGNRTP